MAHPRMRISAGTCENGTSSSTPTTSAAETDAADTIRVPSTTPSQTTKPMPTASGASARKTPAEVATPLPPLKPV